MMDSEQWRVSFTAWPLLWPESCTTSKLYDNESEARDHIVGLKSMESDHELRPCDQHVWGTKLERRASSPWVDAAMKAEAEARGEE